MRDFRSIRTTQETEVHASARFVPAVEIPVFSMNSPYVDLETPAWSPPYNIIITNAVLTTVQLATPAGGSSQVAVRKRNDLLPYDDPDTLFSLSASDTQKREVLDLSGTYTTNLTISPYDNIYCVVASGDGIHAHLAIQLYGYREDRLR